MSSELVQNSELWSEFFKEFELSDNLGRKELCSLLEISVTSEVSCNNRSSTVVFLDQSLCSCANWLWKFWFLTNLEHWDLLLDFLWNLLLWNRLDAFFLSGEFALSLGNLAVGSNTRFDSAAATFSLESISASLVVVNSGALQGEDSGVNWSLELACRLDSLAFVSLAFLGELAAVKSSSVVRDLLESAVVLPFLGQNESSPFAVLVENLAFLVDTLFSVSATLSLLSTLVWSPFAFGLSGNLDSFDSLAIVGLNNTFLASANRFCNTANLVLFIRVDWSPFARNSALGSNNSSLPGAFEFTSLATLLFDTSGEVVAAFLSGCVVSDLDISAFGGFLESNEWSNKLAIRFLFSAFASGAELLHGAAFSSSTIGSDLDNLASIDTLLGDDVANEFAFALGSVAFLSNTLSGLSAAFSLALSCSNLCPCAFLSGDRSFWLTNILAIEFGSVTLFANTSQEI